MKKLLYITNIPAPYRQKRFNLMQEIFPRYGIEFEVLYMAKIEPNRNWKIPEDSYRYNYKFFKGIHPSLGGFFAHFNPSLLLRLLRDDYDIVVVGGMASPTHWLAPFFISKRKVQIMSVESNMYSVRKTKGFGAWIKKTLLKKANAYQVTGSPQIEYIQHFYPHAKNKKYIRLPNLIDEELYRDKVKELRLNQSALRKEFGVKENEQMWILPARLIAIKGIIPFIKLFEGINNVRLYLLGAGEQEEEVRKLITEKRLPVKVVGFVQQNEVVRYYAASDLFVLPSIKDPSPLTPIEATAAALPILVSKRIGNLEDVLENGVNGLSYDPIDEVEKGKDIVLHISKMSREELSEMGKKSLERYMTRFESLKCLEVYAENIISLL